MTHATRIHWLICYDIGDPKRLARVHRYLKKEGYPVQYSVFMLQADRAAIGKVLDHLETLIDPDRDDIRAYPIPENTWKAELGASLLPEDVWITDT